MAVNVSASADGSMKQKSKRKKEALSDHGTKRRWRDVVRSDVETIGIGERWYELCQDRKEWFKLCSEGVEKVSLSRTKNTCSANNQPQIRRLICACGRSFRRKGDRTRHQRFCDYAD